MQDFSVKILVLASKKISAAASRRTILKINRDVLPYNYNVNLLPVFMQIFKVIFLQTQTFAELEQKLRRRIDYYLMNDFHA